MPLFPSDLKQALIKLASYCFIASSPDDKQYSPRASIIFCSGHLMNMNTSLTVA